MSEAVVPPEVVIYQGRQLLAPRESGGMFPRYIPCAGGCGYVIGGSDATGEVWHQSCWDKLRPLASDGQGATDGAE